MKKLCLLFTVWVVSLSAYAYTGTLLRGIKDTADCHRWVESCLSKMTLKQKIGQLFIHTADPLTTSRNQNNLRKAIDEYGLGGLLFTKGEIGKQVRLTNLAQQWSEIPLLITFDGEWGLGMRLADTPVFPKNRVIGCIRDDSLVYRYGKEVARQLREIGVQANFAPVADVDNNPDNPVINVRSFGSNPEEVARKVVAYAQGLEDGGVMAICKHFPGHGDTETDSHYALPILQFDRQRLDSVELYPFRQAIEAGISGVMVGHLQVSELEDKPASISRKVIGSLLQDELHFSGLVFTDALEMNGIRHVKNVSAQALMAGNDMLLVPRNLQREMLGVLDAVKKGWIDEDAITEKCRKVLTYKYALGLTRRPVVEEEGIENRICMMGTDTLLTELDKAAVVVLKDSDGTLPLNLSSSGNVLLSISTSLAEAYPFYKGLKKSMEIGWIHAREDSLPQIRERLCSAQRVIVAVHQEDCRPYLSLIRELASEKMCIVVCFMPQRVLESVSEVMPEVSVVVLAHASKEQVQLHVADILVGKDAATGRLSVGMNGLWDAGTGIMLNPDRPYSYVPEDFGMDSFVLARIDTIACEGIRERAFPGCHVLILKEGHPVYDKCFGTFVYGDSQKVTENDLYDLASLSKVAGTLLAIMKLYDEGRFGLTDEVSRYLSVLKGTDKEHITIRDLLFHESGLPAYLPFYKEVIDMKTCKGGLFRKNRDRYHHLQVDDNLYACTDFSYKEKWVSHVSSQVYALQLSDSLWLNPSFKQEMMRQIVESPLKGNSYRYSCLNFMLLKELVEELVHTPMDIYLDSVFYKPMGLKHITYNPLKRFDKSQIVPTAEDDFLRKGRLHGWVNDGMAAFMGGVSGNAGLFATAHDVGVIFQMLLDRGVYGGRCYLSRATCDLFINLQSKSSRRGLGFDKPDMDHPDNSPCAPDAPASVFGHTGFTGTCVWVDPENELVFVFLSNRTYPHAFNHHKLMQLDIRSRMQQAMYQSLKR